MIRANWPLLILMLAVVGVVGVAALFSLRHGRALQAPKMGFDMVTAGNVYDENTNAMTVGPIDSCLTTEPPGNGAQHNHAVHLIIFDVEDFVGWQARVNYDGGRFRPSTVNFTPLTDNLRGQNISFTNLPIDPASGVHRDIVNASDIPPPAAGAQTAAFGAVYVGGPNAPVSPDTPPRAPPDDTSYSAPAGGILAALNLQVLPGQAGQPGLSMDLDDGDPNGPGSGVAIFDGTTSQDVLLAESALFDGFHGEGAACVPPPGAMTPPPPGAPGAPGGPAAPGGPGGPGDPGGGPGTSPGATSGPGGGTPGPGATGSPNGGSPDASRSPTPTPDRDSDSDSDEDDGGNGGDDGNGGSTIWPFILIGAIAATAAAAYAGWRYRSRLPWLRDRFP